MATWNRYDAEVQLERRRIREHALRGAPFTYKQQALRELAQRLEREEPGAGVPKGERMSAPRADDTGGWTLPPSCPQCGASLRCVLRPPGASSPTETWAWKGQILADYYCLACPASTDPATVLTYFWKEDVPC